MFAQRKYIKALKKVSRKDTIPMDKAIIYGNFIQRLGFSGGGFGQDIRLINLSTKEILTFRVKPIFKMAKENTFFCFIKPGTYAILNYWWTQSKWYGGKIFTEQIFKDFHATDYSEQKIHSEQTSQTEWVRFTFEITKNSLNYLGTWHFDNRLVSFTDDKIQFDNLVKSKYEKLDFSTSKTVLPN
jgi:hypothetical protein